MKKHYSITKLIINIQNYNVNLILLFINLVVKNLCFYYLFGKLFIIVIFILLFRKHLLL